MTVSAPAPTTAAGPTPSSRSRRFSDRGAEGRDQGDDPCPQLFGRGLAGALRHTPLDDLFLAVEGLTVAADDQMFLDAPVDVGGQFVVLVLVEVPVGILTTLGVGATSRVHDPSPDSLTRPRSAA